MVRSGEATENSTQNYANDKKSTLLRITGVPGAVTTERNKMVVKKRRPTIIIL
jgi:hypothetical protein